MTFEEKGHYKAIYSEEHSSWAVVHSPWAGYGLPENAHPEQVALARDRETAQKIAKLLNREEA